MTNRLKPSPDDARARIGRAKEHITSLEREIAAVMPPDRTVRKFVTGTTYVGGQAEYVDAPPILAILIGETIYNLRAALDYLVYELAYLDTGKPKNGTKFLIEDAEEGWNVHLGIARRCGKKLRGLWLPKLTAEHQAALKTYQPCFGCKWTLTLRALSNPDKHHRLVAVAASKGDKRRGAIAFGTMMVTLKLTTHIAFEDGAPVVETLKLLQKQVANVIEAFAPDFR